MKKIFSIICLSLLLFLSFGVNKFEVHAATPVGSPVTLSISTYFDSDNIVTASTGSIAYGSQVSFASSLNPSSSTGYEFVCWLVNGTVQYLPEDYTFTATNNLELTGVFKPVGEYSVIFMDANGQKIDIQYVALNGAAVEPSTVSYTKPGYVYQTPSKWSVPFNDVTFDIITVLQYVPDETPTSLSLTVENGTDITSKGPGPYSLNNVVTVQAAADTAIEFFQYWRIENTIVSYEATYSFTMLQNTTITAVYGGTPATDAPLISLVSGINIRENYTSFLGNIYLPSEDTLVEFGLITHATLVDFTLDDDNVTQIVGTKINPETNEFLFSLTSLGIEHVRAYLVYKEGEILHTIYSGSETPELFISEYGEGSSNNKWIEIYNPTSGGVNLNDYHLELYTNGSTTGVAYAFPTDYVLAAGDTYVYYNTSASDTVKSYGDGSSPVANFNGNDAIGLFKNTTLIDQFGIIGNDPGTNWFENGISTIDHTLIRKLYVTTPNANWNPSEWLQFDIDYFNNIGVVGFPSPSEVVISGGTSVYVGYATQLSATVNPHGTAQTVLWTTSDDAIATVSSTGLVTGVSPGIVTITATSVQDFGVYNTSEVTVNAPVYYDVLFEENGADGTVTDQSILDGLTATEPANPIKSGYTFDGWYTDNSTFLNEYNFSSLVVENVTLYAKWIEVIAGEPVLKFEMDFTTTTGITTTYKDLTSVSCTNIVPGGSSIPTSAHRIAANTASAVVDVTRALIISPRTGDDIVLEDGISWLMFDFEDSTISKLTFDIYYWNSDAEQYFSKIELQSWNGSEWVSIYNLKTYLSGSSTVLTFNIEDLSSSKFRIYTEGGKNEANDARLCIDNFKAYE